MKTCRIAFLIDIFHRLLLMIQSMKFIFIFLSDYFVLCFKCTNYNKRQLSAFSVDSSTDEMNGFKFPPKDLFKIQSCSSLQNTKNNEFEIYGRMISRSSPTVEYYRKRVIFISFVQLNYCIDTVPESILEDAIFCFRADRSWFFPSSLIESKQAQQSIVGRLDINSKIVDYIYEKDKQGLMLWLSRDKTWLNISNELQKIPDIYMQKLSNLSIDGKQQQMICYKPLILDVSWWLDTYTKKEEFQSCFFADGKLFFL